MVENVVRKASDLDPDIREKVGRLFGRPLKADEVVTVTVSSRGETNEEKRAEAIEGLKRSMHLISQALKDVPRDELEEIIEEATDYVRHHPE